MCGYCVESAFVCRLLGASDYERKAPLLSSAFYSFSYLQEAQPLTEGLKWISTRQMGNSFVHIVVACRGLETLLTEGFSSTEYQALLENPAFVSAIKAFCESPNQLNEQMDDPRLDVSSLAWITDYRNFSEAGYLEDKLISVGCPDAEYVLDQYIRLYLEGSNLRHNDLNGEFEQSGIYDPLRDVCEEEHKLVTRSLPYLWIALIRLARNQPDSKIVWELVRTSLAGVPEFHSVGLWLQRRATLLAYDHSGINPFLDDLPLIRAELFQYLAVQRAIPAEELAELTARIERLPDRDHQGNTFSLRNWLIDGDLQLS